jgi:CDP-4-dehydro-6-deoxyglucose reductase
VRLRVFGTDVAVDTLPGEAILTALTRTGYSYKFGCKRGGCGICTLGLVDGDVEYPVTVAQSVLPDEQRAHTVLSCRAVPVSDCTVRMNPDSLFKSVAPFFSSLMQAKDDGTHTPISHLLGDTAEAAEARRQALAEERLAKRAAARAAAEDARARAAAAAARKAAQPAG